MRTTHASLRALLATLTLSAMALSQNPGNWSVTEDDPVDQVATSVGESCTYRIHVNPNMGDVEVIVKGANGIKIEAASGDVEGGDSRDFDVPGGGSIEVKYKTATSNGTYERL